MTFSLSRPAFVRRFTAGAHLSAAILVLAACGGGGDPVSPTSDATAVKNMRALDADDGWTTIAKEGERFTVPGTQTVRYGSGSTWITMQVNGSGECSNGAFGRDPLYGVVKECQTQSSSGGGWTAIAAEHSSFTVNGTQTVRYGSGTSWITQSVSGAGECSNEFFGADPLYGVVKECQVASAAVRAAGDGRGRRVHATRGCGRHVRHGRDGRRRQRGELHRSRPARRRRGERRRQVQLRAGSGDDRDLPHDRPADRARHGHRRRKPGHPRWRRQCPNLQPGAAELPDQHARPHAAAHHAAQRPGTRRRIRCARSGPSKLRVRLCHRQRRGDRSARRATARHRRPLPGQRCRRVPGRMWPAVPSTPPARST